MRARGLKQTYPYSAKARRLSRPMRARGLKQIYAATMANIKQVAPHAGAWVETVMEGVPYPANMGRAPCGRVG